MPVDWLAMRLALVAVALATFIFAGISPRAKAADIPDIRITERGPNQRLPLRETFNLVGDTPADVDVVNAIFVRYSWPVWGIGRRRADGRRPSNCQEVVAELDAEAISAPRLRAGGVMSVDELWPSARSSSDLRPGKSPRRLASLRRTERVFVPPGWTRAQADTKATASPKWTILVENEPFFRPGARYCLLIVGQGKATSVAATNDAKATIKNATKAFTDALVKCNSQVSDCFVQASEALTDSLDGSSAPSQWDVQADRDAITDLVDDEVRNALVQLQRQKENILKMLGAEHFENKQAIASSVAKRIALASTTEAPPSVENIESSGIASFAAAAPSEVDLNSINISQGDKKPGAGTLADLVELTSPALVNERSVRAGATRVIDLSRLRSVLETSDGLTYDVARLREVQAAMESVITAAGVDPVLKDLVEEKEPAYILFERVTELLKAAEVMESRGAALQRAVTVIVARYLSPNGIEAAIDLNQTAFFGNYVTTTANVAWLLGEHAGSIATVYVGVQMSFMPNPVEDPMWSNGFKLDLPRVIALEVGLRPAAQPYGPADRYGPLPNSKVPPVFVGAALHLIPYTTIGIGSAFFGYRRSVLGVETRELRAAPYIGISVQGNFISIIKNLATGVPPAVTTGVTPPP